MTKKIIKLIVPPFFFLIVRKILNISKKESFTASWNTIQKGYLQGIKLLVPHSGMFQEMLDGDYDIFFSNYIQSINLQGKTVFDIGAHIGYDTLLFAKAVGKNGHVIAFEPNTKNRERLEKIVAENKEYSNQIQISDYAISNKEGSEEFIFSDNVDNGTSSGSFMEGSHTFWEKGIYEKNIGFTRTSVKTIPLDSLIRQIALKEAPGLIKIDVEGAEYLVIEGGKDIIQKYKPHLLIEIHSIFNGLKVTEYMKDFNYTIELLKEEKDGRCFISAKPNIS